MMHGAEGRCSKQLEQQSYPTAVLARNPSLVEVDPSQLEQVFLNIAVNGASAGPEGGW